MSLSPIARVCAAVLVVATAASAQNWRDLQGGRPEGAEPLIEWQRTLADGEFLSRQSGKPLLVCVNLDGEAASEAFAQRKYTDPDFAELTRAFVCVIISPVRHNPRDHDDRGRRIPCERFGVVTCGEHLAADVPAYEKYFDGRRVAPRHVGVSPAGDVLFDRFLDQNIGRVDAALREFGVTPEPSKVRERLASRAATDRTWVEEQYLAGNERKRARILREAIGSNSRPIDLVRLGLREPEPKLRSLAQRALVSYAEVGAEGSDGTLELLLDTLAREQGTAERKPLVAALEFLARSNEGARTQAVAQRAIDSGSSAFDLEAWTKALARTQRLAPEPDGPADPEELTARLERVSKALDRSPGDANLQLELARTSLAFAYQRMASGDNPSFFLMDAGDQANQARSMGASGWEVAAVRAQSVYLLNDRELAARESKEALAGLIERASTAEAERVLDVLASVRTASIYQAERAGEAWPGAWLSDAHAAFEALAAHPRSSASQVVAHADLLGYLRLDAHLEAVVRRGLMRFPANPDLHQRLRGAVERLYGIPALEEVYRDLASRKVDRPAHLWFQGYARLVVAEHAQRTGSKVDASLAYGRAIESFLASASKEEAYGDSARHFVALAQAGRARVFLESGKLGAASQEIVAAIRTRPATLEAPDGLERTPLYTLREVRRALEREQAADVVAELAKAIDEIDPEIWSKSES